MYNWTNSKSFFSELKEIYIITFFNILIVFYFKKGG